MTKHSITIIDWVILLAKLTFAMIAFGLVQVYLIGIRIFKSLQARIEKTTVVISATLSPERENRRFPIPRHVLDGIFTGNRTVKQHKKSLFNFWDYK